MINYIVIIVLVLVILLQEIVHSRERKDLYTRLMARDLYEYNQITKGVRGGESGDKTKQGTNILKKRIDKSYHLLHGEQKEV
ncbi:hypothetical protein [Lysinibacillus sp. BSL11]